jgi:DNA-directed RNA polymerase subunit E'/Rpb7
MAIVLAILFFLSKLLYLVHIILHYFTTNFKSQVLTNLKDRHIDRWTDCNSLVPLENY